MSFSFDPTKNQAGATPATTAAGTPSFSFGATGAGDAGKTLGSGFSLMSTPAQNKPSTLFNPGLTAAPAQPAGFTFATTSTTAAPALGVATPSTQTSGLTFGTTTAPASNISFGASPATSISFGAGGTTSFTLGSTAASTAPVTTGLSFGTPKQPTGAGIILGGTQATPSTGASGLTFGTPNTAVPSTGFSLVQGGTTTTATGATPVTTTSSGFSLGSIPATTSMSQQGLSIDGIKPTNFGVVSTNAVTASAGFALGTAANTSASTGFNLGGGIATTTTSGFNLGKTTQPAAPSSLTTATTQVTLGTTTTVSSSTSGAQPGSINFCQLEESINKWTLELEEQEKAFVNQAAQVNAWDKLLITNGEKIVTLNQEVERVKLEQQQLKHELDYVVGQQKELQDCLVPLEKELASLSVSDPEREYTYRLAENLDTQLKQMSEDLKEIIEHLNEANRAQDSSDPIVQIGKILNAHMNSLQWLDQRTTLLSQKIQQIDQMHQNFRQENERNFSLAYN